MSGPDDERIENMTVNDAAQAGRSDATLIRPSRPVSPGLDELVTAVRAAVGTHADWRETAQLVAGELRRYLPSPEILSAEQRVGDPENYRSQPLYIEPDGSFSIVALVWRPGQVTPIHDHVTWCVFGVLQGVEYEEVFTLDETEEFLVETGSNSNRTGDVNGFAPPGDIHRVRNVGDGTAISLHIYGTDVSRIGSSVRRYYDLPVRPA
ncbi:MAG TPA: cysteine dioxygenase family protein [Actinomycetota bacterium]|nr:cysteine dioxygenase family protein [Actinomycetota bacterium]